MEILKEYRKLLNSINNIEDGFLSITLDEESIFRLAVDNELNPTILISEEMFEKSNHHKTNFRLDKLDLQFNVLCHVKDIKSEKVITAPFTIIRQVNGNSRMHDYFLRVIEGMIFELSSELTISRLTKEINYLVKLFSSTKKVDDKTVLGLWGELLYILSTNDRDYAVKGWHIDKHNLFDFSFSNYSVEVKTTTKNKRVHEFNNSQIKKYNRLKVTVVSIITEKASLGRSVLDLWSDITESCLSNESKSKVSRIISETVNQDINALSQIKYNYGMGESTKKEFNSENLPFIKQECIHSGVEDVRLKVNLDMLKSPF